MNAKKVFTMYGKYSNVVTYEYRGMTYDVEYSNNWSYCVTPAAVQHKDAQLKIDKAIEEMNKPKKPHRYEDTAEYGFNLFWEYCEKEGDSR